MSWQSSLFNVVLRVFFKSRVAGKDFHVARAVMGRILESAAQRLTPPAEVKFAAAAMADVSCAWVHVAGSRDERRTIIYCHGGAFVAGSPRTHLDIAWRLSAATKMRVLLVDYRLAPDHVFPAPIEDLLSVYRALLAQGITPKEVAFAGDSAGANLSLATLLRLRDDGQALPAACVCLSPWVDLTLSGESAQRNVTTDSLLPVDLLRNAAAVYAGGQNLALPGLSPLFADLSGLPPLWICASDSEVLLDDARRLAERGRTAGVPVWLEVWHAQAHAFPTLEACIPEARVAISRMASFLVDHLAPR